MKGGRSPAGQTEAQLLREWLRRTAAGSTFALVRTGAAELRAAILSERPRARVVALLESASDLHAAERELETFHGRLSVRLASESAIPGEEPDLVVLRSSGFEGRSALEADMRAAHDALPLGGSVLVVTHQKRGAARQLDTLRSIFGNGEIVRRGGGGFRLLHATRARSGTVAAPAETSSVFEDTVRGKTFVFQTAPSVFSRSRLDRGTRSLLEHLPPDLRGEVLDLGCGYGPIGIVIASCFAGTRVTMVDVSVRAVELAAANARINGVSDRTEAFASDGLRTVPERRFDTVVTHFPLHVPRHDLVRLLRESHGRLTKGGRLYGVGLRPYDVTSAVHDVFGNVRTVAEIPPAESDAGYRVIEAEKT